MNTLIFSDIAALVIDGFVQNSKGPVTLNVSESI